jgi:DNA-binding HxlR family transcriptional regulator
MDNNNLYQVLRGIIVPGLLLKGGAYRVLSLESKRIRLERTTTGSRVNVSTRMIAETLLKLEDGEFIGRRSISYTVTIEFVTVYSLRVLGALIETSLEGVKGYSLSPLWRGLDHV